MDVFKLLKQDHKEVKALFKKLENSRPSKAREKGTQQLYQAVSVHTEVEENIFYPRLREEEKLREMINEAFEEHHAAKLVLEEFAKTSIEDERWEAKLSVLKEMIEHHVQEEEKQVFPKATRLLGKDEAKSLGKQIEAAKKELQGARGKRASADTQSESRASA